MNMPGFIRFISLSIGLLLHFGTMARSVEMTDFKNKGPNLFESSSEWIAGKGTLEVKEGITFLEGPESGLFRCKTAVQPDAEYFFSARVKSADRVVFTAPPLSMSYHDQGTWGEVCGLIPSKHRTEIEIAIQFRPIGRKGIARVELKDVVLRKVERPSAVAAHRHSGTTALVADGKDQAAIVYPSTIDAEKALAVAIQEKIRQRTGVVLPVLADMEVTDNDSRAIKPEFREKNLILIGRLGTNRAMASAYARFLDAVDGYHPGGDGYLVRTAANVFGNGRNHLILGGSEPAGVSGAVTQFLHRLGEVKGETQKSLELPWLLDVKLGGKCKEAFLADNARWLDPKQATLPAMTAGYGKVSRWYQNAMGYYWSGMSEYRKRSQGHLKEILADKAYTHHYLAEFLVRVYEMFNESPVLTQEEKSAMEALIAENFLDFMTGPDASWMTTFSPPYADLGLINRHQIAPWIADLVMARFLQQNLLLSGDFKALVDFRVAEKEKAFRYLVSNRSGPNHFELGNSSYEEITATFFRYAMENDLYREFFASGLAKDALGLERLNPLNGRLIMPVGMRDLEPLLGVMGIVQNDGQYRWLRENVQFPARELGSFQGRYVADVHRYDSGPELAAVKPGPSWLGITVSPVPTRNPGKLSLPTNEFPLVTMRSGFGPKDDYIAITGVENQQPAGTLAAMILHGNPIFMAASPEGGSGANRTTTNGATAIRLTGYNASAAGRESETCVLNWSAEFSGCWAFQTETRIAPEVHWKRNTVRLKPGLVVFCDRFTASKPGEYALRVNWQPGKRIEEKNGVWKLALPTGGVQVEMLGAGFNGQRREETLTWASVQSMEPGKEVTVWTVVYAGASRMPASDLQESDRLIVTPEGSEPVILRAGEVTPPSGPVKADLLVMDESGISILGPKCVYLPRNNGEDAARIARALKEETGSTDKPATSSRDAEVAIGDESVAWEKGWSYDGLLKPAEAKPRVIDENTIDFGKVVSLDEVRSVPRSKRAWEPSFLPGTIRVTSDETKNAAAWKLLEGTKKSRPGTRTGNYGESHPEPHADESLFVDGVKARFINADGAAHARYFVRDHRVARHPVRVEVLRDLPGHDKPLIAAASKLFPAFPRPLRDDDFSLTVLGSEGAPVAQLDIAGPVQGTLIADRKGKGTPEIMVLKADARIETFDLTGEPGPVVDLYAMHLDFNRKYGRPNTRHPAGGLMMPFSFGLWRANKDGAKKMVVARYGQISFLDENFQLEGVLAAGPYACSGMLAQGGDFSGSGKDEVLILERGSLIHVGGSEKERMRHKKAAVSWPEVYDVLFEKGTPDTATRLLSGAPIEVFEVLKHFSGRSRYAAVVRANYVGLYDAVKKNWTFSWQPPAPIAAAAVTKESEGEVEISLSTVDGLWWKATWRSEAPGKPSIEVQSPGWVANELRGTPSRDGSAIISTNDGLLLLDREGRFSRIAAGAFQSADLLSDRVIVAADGAGRIISYRAR